MAEEAINHSIGVITSNEDNATSLGTKNQLYTVLVQLLTNVSLPILHLI
ncbi:SusD/RagB family nutrient-binding outer membrane lipoprotein [Bacteroides ovatus]|nr:SusD/RagB family nutrient-binding outer membrane lipoprotein [Bacteroides ovatus]